MAILGVRVEVEGRVLLDMLLRLVVGPFGGAKIRRGSRCYFPCRTGFAGLAGYGSKIGAVAALLLVGLVWGIYRKGPEDMQT